MNETIKNELTKIGNDRSKWNKIIKIEGNKYQYISAKNEFRKLIEQSNHMVAILIGFMCLNKFIEFI